MSSRKTFTCVLCPRGCGILVEYDPSMKTIFSIEQAGCRKGREWVQQELIHPVRTLCSSVLVQDGEEPLVSVKTDREVPLSQIPNIMEEIRSTRISAPVSIEDVIISNPAGTTCKITATRSVGKK